MTIYIYLYYHVILYIPPGPFTQLAPQISVNQSLGHAHIGVGEHVVADLPEEELSEPEADPAATATPANFDLPEWKQAWLCRPSTPVSQIGFSEDGLLFATCSKNDRLVKIWYENKRGR